MAILSYLPQIFTDNVRHLTEALTKQCTATLPRVFRWKVSQQPRCCNTVFQSASEGPISKRLVYCGWKSRGGGLGVGVHVPKRSTHVIMFKYARYFI